jgi:L-methionine (R)-S-oxide reductase
VISVRRSRLFKILTERAEEILGSGAERDDILLGIALLLKENVPHYSWVGFYLPDPDEEGYLVLGPFAGDPTEHTRIRYGEGICGQAAETKNIFIVQDVSKEDNYLSCSPTVGSEVVVPIFKNGEFAGELDIDSDELEAFTKHDRKFTEEIASMLERII